VKDAGVWKERMGFSREEVMDILEGDGKEGIPRVWEWKFDFVLPSKEAVREMKERM